MSAFLKCLVKFTLGSLQMDGLQAGKSPSVLMFITRKQILLQKNDHGIILKTQTNATGNSVIKSVDKTMILSSVLINYSFDRLLSFDSSLRHSSFDLLFHSNIGRTGGPLEMT